MKTPLLYISFVLLFPLPLVAQFSIKEFSALYALEGTWKKPASKIPHYEKWEIINDLYLQGKSFKINGNDTIPEESIQLEYKNGLITYTPAVPTQNEGKPISFKLIQIKGTQFIFENKTHSFPQKITYQLVNKNTLNAIISGKTKKGYKKIPFSFKRVE